MAKKGISNWSYDEIKEYIKSNNYKLISSEYIKGQKIKVMCEHNHEYEVAWDKFYIGQRCKECFRKRQKLDFFDVKKYIENEGYILLSNEYINNSEKLDLKCNKGHTYEASFEKFMCDQRCPKCSMTDGEFKINKYLSEYDFNFSYQHKFKDCKIKHSLPFDFVVFDDNNNPILAIEYDGIHHYKSIYGNEEDFNYRKKYDEYKDQYCKNNNIEMLRIPYFEFKNIEIILQSKLNK